MENFFNQTIATGLQYLTFPLELIGLSLALIEVRFPKAAAYLTRQIERMSEPMQGLRSGRSESEKLVQQSLAVFLSRLIKSGFYILTAIYGAKLIYQLLNQAPQADRLVGMLISYIISAIILIIALVVLGVVVFFLVVGGSDFARRFVAGRAIGTLGILIAGLGLLGELYQLLTQIVN